MLIAGRSPDTQVTPVTDILTILFDLNGVLYSYDRDARIAYLAGDCPTIAGLGQGGDLGVRIRGSR